MLVSVAHILQHLITDSSNVHTLAQALRLQNSTSSDFERRETGVSTIRFLNMVAEPGADSVYKSHSGSIVETSEDLKAKAESQMAEARQTEVTASHNFQMRQQFLEDELKFNAQDLEAAKHSLGEAQGQLTADTADLKMTADALAEDTATLEDAKQDCQAKAVEFEASVKSRSEELEALAKAQTVISEKTGGAETFSYGLTQTSFLQLSRSVLSSRGGLAKFGAVRKIRELAKSEHSLELAQLASRVASAMHAETSTGDVNTHVQHVVHTVEVERPRIIKQTVQKPIIQEKIPELQFTDKVVNIPVLAQRRISSMVQVRQVRVVEKTFEIPQLPFMEKIIEIPEIRTVRDTQTSESLSVVDSKGSNRQDCEVLFRVNRQSPDIAGGVRVDRDDLHAMSAAAGTQQPHRSKQQQHQDKPPQATRQQPRKEEEEEKGRGEREKGRKGQRGSGQEGRKEEEKEAEDGGEQVEKDVTGWTEVTRNKRKKMVQIFVKVDGMKTVAMEVSPEDKVQKILKTVSGSDRDVYVTSGGRILRGSGKLKSFGVRDGSTVEVTSRMRGGGGKHREKKSKTEKERSGSPKKIEQAQGQKAEVEPSRNVDEMYVLMEEQMRLMSEEAKNLQVTDEVMQRIVEHVVKMRLMTENMKKQASDDDLQRVEKMEQGLKVFMEEMRDRQKELETRETKEEQNVKMSSEDDVGRKATREGRGCAGLVQRGNETHRMNETCGKGKGKGNGGKGEHGGKGEDGGKGHEGTRKLRWADCEEEEGRSETRSSRGRVAQGKKGAGHYVVGWQL